MLDWKISRKIPLLCVRLARTICNSVCLWDISIIFYDGVITVSSEHTGSGCVQFVRQLCWYWNQTNAVHHIRRQWQLDNPTAEPTPQWLFSSTPVFRFSPSVPLHRRGRTFASIVVSLSQKIAQIIRCRTWMPCTVRF